MSLSPQRLGFSSIQVAHKINSDTFLVSQVEDASRRFVLRAVPLHHPEFCDDILHQIEAFKSAVSKAKTHFSGNIAVFDDVDFAVLQNWCAAHALLAVHSASLSTNRKQVNVMFDVSPAANVALVEGDRCSLARLVRSLPKKEDTVWRMIASLSAALAAVHNCGHHFAGAVKPSTIFVYHTDARSSSDIVDSVSPLMEVHELQFLSEVPASLFYPAMDAIELELYQMEDVASLGRVALGLADTILGKEHCSPELLLLLQRMIAENPSDRPRAQDVFSFQSVSLRVRCWMLQRQHKFAENLAFSSNAKEVDELRCENQALQTQLATLAKREEKMERFLQLYALTRSQLDSLPLNQENQKLFEDYYGLQTDGGAEALPPSSGTATEAPEPLTTDRREIGAHTPEDLPADDHSKPLQFTPIPVRKEGDGDVSMDPPPPPLHQDEEVIEVIEMTEAAAPGSEEGSEAHNTAPDAAHSGSSGRRRGSGPPNTTNTATTSWMDSHLAELDSMQKQLEKEVKRTPQGIRHRDRSSRKLFSEKVSPSPSRPEDESAMIEQAALLLRDLRAQITIPS